MSTVRIPLAVPLETRESQGNLGNITTDSYLTNCYIETQPDGRKFVVKRPGQFLAYSYNGGAATNGQGTNFYKGCVYAMGSNVLYRVSGSGNGSADGTAWTSSTAAPWSGRSNFGSCVFNGLIYIMGGHNTGGLAQLNDVWSSPDGMNWTQVSAAAPWAKRIDMGVVVLGNTMYLLGGTGASGDFNDVWSTQDGINWTQLVGTAPWPARDGGGYVAFNQGLWVIAGFNTASSTYLNDVWFSPDGITWTQMVTAAGFTARAWAGTVVCNGKIVVAGGYNGARQSDIWISSDGITWAFPQNLPAVRSHMAVTSYNGRVWFVGGYDNTATRTTTVWSWPVTATPPTVVAASYGGTAIQGGSMVVLRTQTGVNTLNSATMWLMGGDTGAAFLNAIYYATLNVALPSTFTPTGTGATTSEQWQSTTQNAGDYLIWKNTSDAWVLYTGTLTKITSTNYPKTTVQGLVNLDDTIYVMDQNGVIYGSNLSDPFTWSALNFITADYVADTGVALVKYQNYILALKTSSSQLFYDAGRYPGSPLLPAVQYNSRIGCFSANSVVSFNNTVIWVARTEELGPYVVALEGVTAKKISVPWVDRLMANLTSTTIGVATSARLNGHYFYYLPLTPWNYTLVYDFTEDTWHVEKTGTASVYGIVNYVTDGQYDYFQDPAVGKLYRITPQLYQDAGATTTITCVIQTIKFDGGNNRRKFTTSLTVIGDRLSPNAPVFPNQATISWSDDDAQTFSTGQVVDLTIARPKINRTGSFRRRQWNLVHTSNNPMRLEALELSII